MRQATRPGKTPSSVNLNRRINGVYAGIANEQHDVVIAPKRNRYGDRGANRDIVGDVGRKDFETPNTLDAARSEFSIAEAVARKPSRATS
jgi:hypothetical protein